MDLRNRLSGLNGDELISCLGDINLNMEEVIGRMDSETRQDYFNECSDAMHSKSFFYSKGLNPNDDKHRLSVGKLVYSLYFADKE